MKTPSKHLFGQIIDALQEGVAIVDVEGPDLRIGWFNSEFARITAMRAGALANQSARQLVERLGGSVAMNRLTAIIGAREDGALTLMPTRPDSSQLPLHLRLRVLLNRDKTFSGQYLLLLSPQESREQHADAEALRQELAAARRQVRDMSDDAVTGLASEVRFRQQLVRDWSLATRESYCLSVIVLRMDGFQAYLDTFGQHACDSCLRMLARTVRRRLRRSTDLAGRIGTETMAIVMNGGEPDAVARFARSLCDDVAALRIHHPRSPVARHVTVSVRESVARPQASGPGPDAFLDGLLAELTATG